MPDQSTGRATKAVCFRGRRGSGPALRQRGYTLIEIIVAAVLFAVALTVLLGTLSGATRQVRWSADAGQAALHAQSLLDTVGVGQPLRPGSRNGDFEDGRYRWSLAVSPWVDPAQRNAPQPLQGGGNELYEVVMTVEWGEGSPRERLQMRSLRLVQPALGDPGQSLRAP